MSLATIRAAIVAKLNAISGIGLVHSYERLASRNADLIALYTTGDQILGWLVRRVATREAYLSDDATEPREEVVRWEIRGYMSLRDAEATELEFDDLIEAIRDAFRADDTLGGAVISCAADGVAGIQVEDSGPVMFAGVLSHGVRLRLNTTTMIF